MESLEARLLKLCWYLVVWCNSLAGSALTEGLKQLNRNLSQSEFCISVFSEKCSASAACAFKLAFWLRAQFRSFDTQAVMTFWWQIKWPQQVTPYCHFCAKVWSWYILEARNWMPWTWRAGCKSEVRLFHSCEWSLPQATEFCENYHSTCCSHCLLELCPSVGEI